MATYEAKGLNSGVASTLRKQIQEYIKSIKQVRYGVSQATIKKYAKGTSIQKQIDSSIDYMNSIVDQKIALLEGYAGRFDQVASNYAKNDSTSTFKADATKALDALKKS